MRDIERECPQFVDHRHHCTARTPIFLTSKKENQFKESQQFPIDSQKMVVNHLVGLSRSPEKGYRLEAVAISLSPVSAFRTCCGQYCFTCTHSTSTQTQVWDAFVLHRYVTEDWSNLKPLLISSRDQIIFRNFPTTFLKTVSFITFFDYSNFSGNFWSNIANKNQIEKTKTFLLCIDPASTIFVPPRKPQPFHGGKNEIQYNDA